jgi:hypothetical protein
MNQALYAHINNKRKMKKKKKRKVVGAFQDRGNQVNQIPHMGPFICLRPVHIRGSQTL